MTKKISCPYCFEKFTIEVFLEEGESQEIIYDCEICCHPIEMTATWDAELKKFLIVTNKSTGFN